MPVELRETRLPGIGVKYGFRTSEGGRLAIVLHNDGVREIYFFRHDHDDEPSEVIRLDDDEARQLGAVIGGAYERPKIVEELELALGELTIEWVPVPDESPLTGQTLAECGFRAKTGITVIAILREPEPVAGAQPSDMSRGATPSLRSGSSASTKRFASCWARAHSSAAWKGSARGEPLTSRGASRPNGRGGYRLRLTERGWFV